MASLRKAISPVIATVIIVAIAIAIAVAVVGWLTGLWSSLAGGTPAVSIPSAEIRTDGTYYIYIRNDGSGSDKIIKVELEYEGVSYNCDLPSNAQNSTVLNGQVIKANSAGWVTGKCTLNLTPNPGDKAILRIHLEKSGIIPISVVFRNASTT